MKKELAQVIRKLEVMEVGRANVEHNRSMVEEAW